MAHELDPQVKAFLVQVEANAPRQAKPGHILSAHEKIAAARQAMDLFSVLGLPSESVSKAEDFNIPGPAEDIPVRLYVPHVDGSLPLRVLVYYHGGGFAAGRLDNYDTLLRALANRAKCIVISVAYRLAPEHPYPAGNNDAWAALRWVADHASEIGADPRRLAVGGDSAGGLLAAWVAQKAKANGPALRLQMLLYPNPRCHHVEAFVEGMGLRRLSRKPCANDRSVQCLSSPGD